MNTTLVNGQFVEKSAATLSIFDRGLLFGESIYEVIPVFSGRPFALELHIKRLIDSAQSVFIPPVMNAAEWHNSIQALLSKNPRPETPCYIYIQLTRGLDLDLGRHHHFTETQPSYFAFLQAYIPPTQVELNSGFSAITMVDPRRQACHIKSTALLANTLALNEASKHKALEVIFHRDNIVTDASSSNIFMVKDRTLYTPKTSDFVLDGVTRRLILDLATAHNLSVAVTDIPLSALFAADEVWVTGSTKEICPIVTLNNQPIGNGKPGPLFVQMCKWYHALK